MKKQKLKLNRETLVTLDRGQLADIHGGAVVSRSVCISNNGGGASCGYCPSGDTTGTGGGGNDVSRSVCISNNGGGRSCGWCHGDTPGGGSGW
jgi:hypothetical protein